MNALPLAAVIPAAGSSSRMGHFKPLLRVNGQTLIQRAMSVFRQNRIDDFIVVTEHRRPLCACRLADSIGRSQASGCHGSVV